MIIFDLVIVWENKDFIGEVDGYEFSVDELKMIICSGMEFIYWCFVKANYFVYDWKVGILIIVFDEGKYSYVMFNL